VAPLSNPTDRSAWFPAVVLTVGAAFTVLVNTQQRMDLVRPLAMFPDSLVGRVGTPITVSEAEQAAAGMSSYLMRYFPGDVAPFSLYVGYYDQQTQGRTIHSPKNCLPGSGWDALRQTVTDVTTPAGSFRVNRYLLQNKGARALVFYWYQGRGRVAANEYRVKWELLRDAATRGRSEEALVRIVVFLNDQTDEDTAAAWATRASAEIIPSLFRHLPG
jgi:EpsI family protein